MGFIDSICAMLKTVKDSQCPQRETLCGLIDQTMNALGCSGSEEPPQGCSITGCPSDQYCEPVEDICVNKKADGSSCTSSEECIGFCDLDINQCASF